MEMLKLMKQYIPLEVLLFLSSILLGCEKKELTPGIGTNDSLIKNAHFEEPIVINTNSVWKKWAWQPDKTEWKWEKGKGIEGSNCLMLNNGNTSNDIAIMQEIELEGNKLYEVSAWIKTENVVGGRGANICIYGTYLSSPSFIGTNNWNKVALPFYVSEIGKTSVACRLGFWGATASGKAWFDNLELNEANMFNQQGQHIQIFLKPEDAAIVDQTTITTWLDNLDKAYEKYYELIGQYPYDGKTIAVLSTDTYPGGWAVAGNPILWHQPYIRQTLLDIKNRGDWSFGILHEIGHDYASGIGIEGNTNWNWDEEMFANFRMYYAIELLNGSVLQDKIYTGSDLKNYYKTFATGSYDNKILKGGTDKAGDGIMYTLIRIKDQIGWESFKQTFRHLYNTYTNFSNNWERFNYFLDKLSEYSGVNVRDTYPEGELDIIKEAILND